MQNEIPKIPQNELKNFIFKIDKNIISVIILLDHSIEINLENLFLIFQSYLNKNEILIKNIYILGENNFENDNLKKLNIFRNINIKKLKNMSHIDFIEWYSNIYDQDYEYLRHFKYYGFVFQFYTESIFWQCEQIYPIYPWNENFKQNLVKKYIYINENKKLKEKINKLDNKNKKLLKLIKKIKPRLIRWYKT